MADNELRVGSQFDAEPIIAGMDAAAAKTQEAAAKMTAAFNQQASATLNLKTSQQVLNQILQEYSKGALDASTATSMLARVLEEKTQAAMAAKSATEQLNQVLGVQQGQVTGNFYKWQLFSRELGTRMPRAMEMVLARIPVLSSALNTVFPLLLVAGFIDILSRVPDVIENIIGKLSGWDKEAKKVYETQLKLNQQALSAADTLFEANLRASEADLTGLAKISAEQRDNSLLADHWRQRAVDIGKSYKDVQDKIRDLQTQETNMELAGTAAFGNSGLAAAKFAEWIQGNKTAIKELQGELQKFDAEAISVNSKMQELRGPGATALNRQYSAEAEREDEKLLEQIHRKFEKMMAEGEKRHAKQVKDTEKEEELLANANKAVHDLETKQAEEAAKIWQRVATEKVQGQVEAEKLIQQGELAHFETLRNMGLISANQLLNLKKQELEKEFTLEQGQIIRRIAELDPKDPNSPITRQRLDNELLKLEQQRLNAENKLDDQALLTRKRKWDVFFNGISSSFDSGIKGWIKGTESFGQIWSDVLTSIMDSFISMIVNMVAQWVEKQIFMAVFGRATQSAAGAANATSSAAVGAAAAGASVAAIPLIGWSMVPEVSAATFGILSSFIPLASAAGGMEVPYDMVSQVHKDEKILPARFSRGLEDLVYGKQRQNLTVPITIQAIDSKSFGDHLEEHGVTIFKTLKKQFKKLGFRL